MYSPPTQLYFEQALKLMIPHIPKMSLVLDISPKQGIYSREFSRCGFEVIAVQPPTEPLLDNPFVKEVVQKEVEDILFPYSSIGGIWARQSLNGLPKDHCKRRLSLFYDWLEKNGVLYFSLLEGEGFKWITEQSVTGLERKLVVYYSPQELDDILYDIGYEAIEAWRENKQDRNWLHVIARKNE